MYLYRFNYKFTADKFSLEALSLAGILEKKRVERSSHPTNNFNNLDVEAYNKSVGEIEAATPLGDAGLKLHAMFLSLGLDAQKSIDMVDTLTNAMEQTAAEVVEELAEEEARRNADF